MGVLSHSVPIRAQPDQVWRVYVDPHRIPDWQTGSPVIEDVKGAAGEIGSTYVSRRGRLAAQTTVTDADYPHRLATTTHAYPGFRLEVVSSLAKPARQGRAV